MSGYILHGAIRSSAAYRVRIALNLKGVAFQEIYLDLHAGAHNAADYRELNPQGLVPTLVAPDGTAVTQSMAIIEYLDEAADGPPLLPGDAAGRARVRSLSQMIACDIHPINNLRVRNHVRDLLPADPSAQAVWMDKWLTAGLNAIEARLSRETETGRFTHGESPTMADACLVPQLNNARAAKKDISLWPTIERIAAACDALPAFTEASPARLEASGVSR
jgi:maleylpyruvate isomerase